MGNLTWAHVVLIGAVATIGFTLLSWWYSSVMAKKGWTYQAKNRPPKKGEATATKDARENKA